MINVCYTAIFQLFETPRPLGYDDTLMFYGFLTVLPSFVTFNAIYVTFSTVFDFKVFFPKTLECCKNPQLFILFNLILKGLHVSFLAHLCREKYLQKGRNYTNIFQNIFQLSKTPTVIAMINFLKIFNLMSPFCSKLVKAFINGLKTTEVLLSYFQLCLVFNLI